MSGKDDVAPSAWQLLLADQLANANHEQKPSEGDSSLFNELPSGTFALGSGGTKKRSSFSAIKRQARERRASVNDRMRQNFAGIVETEVEAVVEQVSRGSLHKSNKVAVTEVLKSKGITTKLMIQRSTAGNGGEEPSGGSGANTPRMTAGPDGSNRVPYQLQANAEMYSQSNLDRRKELKTHPELVAALDHWWYKLPKTTAGKSLMSLGGGLNFPMYVWMNKKLYFAFVPTATEAEFKKTVKADWVADTTAVIATTLPSTARTNSRDHASSLRNSTTGAPTTLDIHQFRNAMFTLADIWCETAELDEYVNFIQTCNQLVATPPSYSGSFDECPTIEMKEGEPIPPVSPRGSFPGAGRRQSKVGSGLGSPGSFLASVAKSSSSRGGGGPAKRMSIHDARPMELRDEADGAGDDSGSTLPKLATGARKQSSSSNSLLAPNDIRRKSTSELGNTTGGSGVSSARTTPRGRSPRGSMSVNESTSLGRTSSGRRKSEATAGSSSARRKSITGGPPDGPPPTPFQAFGSPDTEAIPSPQEPTSRSTSKDLSRGRSNSGASRGMVIPNLNLTGTAIVPGLNFGQGRTKSTSPLQDSPRQLASQPPLDLIGQVNLEIEDERVDTRKQVALVLMNAVQLSEETEEATLEVGFEEFKLKYNVGVDVCAVATPRGTPTPTMVTTPCPLNSEDISQFEEAFEQLVVLMKDSALSRVLRRRQLLQSIGADCAYEGEIPMVLSPAEQALLGDDAGHDAGGVGEDQRSHTTLNSVMLNEISAEAVERLEKRAELRQKLHLLKERRLQHEVETEMGGSIDEWPGNKLLLQHKTSNCWLRVQVATVDDEEVSAEIQLACKMLIHTVPSDQDQEELERKTATSATTTATGGLPDSLVEELQAATEKCGRCYQELIDEIASSEAECLKRAHQLLTAHHDHEEQMEKHQIEALKGDQTIPESLRKEILSQFRLPYKENKERRAKEVIKLKDLEVAIDKATQAKRSLWDEFSGMAEDELDQLQECSDVADVRGNEIFGDRDTFEPETDDAGACHLIMKEKFHNWGELTAHIKDRTEHWRLTQVAKAHADDTQRRTDVLSFLDKLANNQWNRDVLARNEAMTIRMKALALCKKMAVTQQFQGLDEEGAKKVHKKLQHAERWTQNETDWITEKNERLSKVHRMGQLKQRQLAARLARLQQAFHLGWESSARLTDLTAKMRSAMRNNSRASRNQKSQQHVKNSPRRASLLASGGVMTGLPSMGTRGSMMMGRSPRASITDTLGGVYDAELLMKEKQAERDRHQARVRFLRDQEQAERQRLKEEKSRRENIGSMSPGRGSPATGRRASLNPQSSQRGGLSSTYSPSGSPSKPFKERQRRALEVAERRAAMEAQHVVKTTIERSRYYQDRGNVNTLTPRIAPPTPRGAPPQSPRPTSPNESSGPAPTPPSAPRPDIAVIGTSFNIRSAVTRDQLRQKLEKECQQFQQLDNTRSRVVLTGFDARQQDYIAEAASNVDIYHTACELHSVGENRTFTSTLSTEPLVYEMSSIKCLGPLNLGTLDVLLDLLLMNPVQSLTLKDMQLNNQDVKKLCEALLNHQFVATIELNTNKALSLQAGHSLKSLVKQNSRIVKCGLSGTSIPAELISEVTDICNTNSFNRHIGRTEFELLVAEFSCLDADNDGVVSKSDVRDRGLRTSTLSSPLVTQKRSISITSPSEEKYGDNLAEDDDSPNGLDCTLSALEKVNFDSGDAGKAASCDMEPKSPLNSTRTLVQMQSVAFERIEKLNSVLAEAKQNFVDDRHDDADQMTLVHLICRVYPQWSADRVVKLIKEYLLDPIKRNHFLSPYFTLTGTTGASLHRSGESPNSCAFGLKTTTMREGEVDTSNTEEAFADFQLEDEENDFMDDLIDDQTFSELKLGPNGIVLPNLDDDDDDEDINEKSGAPLLCSTTMPSTVNAVPTPPGADRPAQPRYDQSQLPSLEELHSFIQEYGDDDGFISVEELTRGLGGANEGADQDLKAAFLEYDLDRDGKLSVDEFMRFMAA